MFCPHCGNNIGDNVKFCPACGQSTEAPGAAQPSPAPTPAPVFTPAGTPGVQIGKWIGEGWNLVKSDFATCIIGPILAFFIASFGMGLLSGAANAGVHILFMKKLLTGRAEIGDAFKGFNFFVPALVASLIVGIFSFIGFLLCIIPGLVVAAAYMFTYLFIVDRKMDFWQAMEASHAVVKTNYVGFTLFLLAMAGLHILGALCCLVGLLVTIPIQYAAVTIAYRDLVGFQSDGNL